MTVKDYRDHLKRLSREHNIIVEEVFGGPRHGARAWPGLRFIRLPEVCDDTSYALALHEFGHLIAPNGSGISIGQFGDKNDPMHCYDLLKEEFAAWAWARENAIEWTNGMEHTQMLCMKSYLDTLERAKIACGLNHAA